ncbi:MAG: hypothetical protein AAF560_15775 [Acidobacteriota bacterium]
MRRNPRPITSAMALLTALITMGCATPGDRVVISPLQSLTSPYSTVTIEVDHERELIRVDPDPVIIWFDSKNPLSQMLWTVRCTLGEGHSKDDVACPRDATVIIRPKEGCSKTLFGATADAPAGEIRIRAPHNAIASGIPNAEEARQLFKVESDTFCDGSSREDEIPMELSESVHDIAWVYEIEVRRPGRKPFKLDPVTWIETSQP